MEFNSTEIKDIKKCINYYAEELEDITYRPHKSLKGYMIKKFPKVYREDVDRINRANRLKLLLKKFEVKNKKNKK